MANATTIDHEYEEDVIDDNRIHIQLPPITDPKNVPTDEGDKGSA